MERGENCECDECFCYDSGPYCGCAWCQDATRDGQIARGDDD